MKTALVIMAAGIGSRFGGGIKQLAPVGPNGEIIMDYSIHDALEAGFNKVVFIIRRDIEKDFRKVPENKEVGDFVHEEDVESFLNLLTKKDNESNYPYSTEEYRD